MQKWLNSPSDVDLLEMKVSALSFLFGCIQAWTGPEVSRRLRLPDF
jgi:hypothetical protein